jgi:multimeric flavodoxin WrbA
MMTSGHILGVSAGAQDGSAEIALKAALLAAEDEGAGVELIRVEELRLPATPATDGPDDSWWFWDQLMDADGVIASAPTFSRTIPGHLKVLMDRLLGPNADRAIVEKLIALRAGGVDPLVPFRLDERVLRNRVAGFIAVGGSLTPQWKTLMLPVLHTLTFSMQAAVVDQIVIEGTGTPKSVLLDDAALQRAAALGRNVAGQLGRPFDDVTYRGDAGLCPMCHLSVVDLRGRDVICATCGATGRFTDAATVEWTDLSTSVISMDEKRAHFEEILATAARHAALADRVAERAAEYAGYDPTIRPTRDPGSPPAQPSTATTRRQQHEGD